MSLTDYELDVIRLAAGVPQTTITGWGAALGAALGPLYRGGYLSRQSGTYTASQKGLDALSQKERSDV